MSGDLQTKFKLFKKDATIKAEGYIKEYHPGVLPTSPSWALLLVGSIIEKCCKGLRRSENQLGIHPYPVIRRSGKYQIMYSSTAKVCRSKTVRTFKLSQPVSSKISCTVRSDGRMRWPISFLARSLNSRYRISAHTRIYI